MIAINVDENLKQEIEFNVKSNESLAENKIRMKLNNYCPNISMKTILMNMETSKSNEPLN